MGSVNSNFLPTSTGLALGNVNQKWTAFLSNVFSDTLQSNTPNPSTTGIIRLASLDSIGWRNGANSADVLLGKTSSASGTTPIDLLTWGGSGIEGPLIGHDLNPAAAGEVRLASGEAINFRNNANSADINGLSHNSDDTVTVGGSAGVNLPGPLNTVGNLAITGNIAATGVITGTGGVNAGATMSAPGYQAPPGTGGVFLAADSAATTSSAGNPVSIIASNGGSNGTTVGGNVNLTVGTGHSGGAAGTIVASGKFSQYGGITLVNGGLPSEIAAVNLNGQTAAITTATLFAVVTAGQYELKWNAKITTAAGTSSTLGALTIVYTDPDGVAVTLTAAAIIAAGSVATSSAANTTGTVLIGIPQLLNCKAGTNVTYAFAYASNAAAAMTYNLNIALLAL